MSTIGSGPNINNGPKIDTTAARTAAQVNSAPAQGASAAATPAPAASTNAAPPAAQVTSAAQSMVSSSTSAGAAPVDTDRTAAIKSAIKNGTYPILPTKISDSMIAASQNLRTAA